MSKTLTTAAVRALKPGRTRREVPDGGCSHLYLVIQPTGRKSWAMRARRPDRRQGKLRLGTVAVAEHHVAEPVIGGHLTLPSARAPPTAQFLTSWRRAWTCSPSIKKSAAAWRRSSTQLRPPRSRSWRETSSSGTSATARASAAGGSPRWHWGSTTTEREVTRGLPHDPTVIHGSLCDRWATRAVGDITKADIRGVVDEARSTGIPGRGTWTKGPSGSREREMAMALGGLFDWLLRHRAAID